MNRLIPGLTPLLLAACVSSGSNAPSGADDASSGTVARLSSSNAPLEMVNTVRAENGMGPLRTSRQLNAAASAHAVDMAQNDFYGHTSPNGDSERDRMTAAGYDACSSRENIAWGQASEVIVTQAWINSPSHLRNILNPKATDIGIAGARDPDGPRDPLWVMVIGARNC